MCTQISQGRGRVGTKRSSQHCGSTAKTRQPSQEGVRGGAPNGGRGGALNVGGTEEVLPMGETCSPNRSQQSQSMLSFLVGSQQGNLWRCFCRQTGEITESASRKRLVDEPSCGMRDTPWSTTVPQSPTQPPNILQI